LGVALWNSPGGAVMGDLSFWQIAEFLAAPFAASLILTGIHTYLGVHVVERGSLRFVALLERLQQCDEL